MEESDKNKRKKKKKKSEIKQKNPKQHECAQISDKEETKNVSKEECVGAFWAAHVSELLPQLFPLFWGENFLVAREENTWTSSHFFPLSLPTKHPLKLLSLHFSLLNLPSSLKSLQTNTPLMWLGN